MKLQIIYPSLLGFLIFIIFLIDLPDTALAQEPFFELPVQLIGFPIIILAVRLSNFVKKLQYSLNPQTYQQRNRRSPGLTDATTLSQDISLSAIDVSLAEKAIIQELGPKACVLEEPCRIHAGRKAKTGAQPEWNEILRDYKYQSTGMKQWYLLSVFIGENMRDVQICKQLAKRLDCNRNIISRRIVRD